MGFFFLHAWRCAFTSATSQSTMHTLTRTSTTLRFCTALLTPLLIYACDAQPAPPPPTQTVQAAPPTQPPASSKPRSSSPPPTLPHIPSALRSPTFGTGKHTSAWVRQWPEESSGVLSDTTLLPDGSILLSTHDSELFHIQDDTWTLLHKTPYPLVRIVSAEHPSDPTKHAVLTLDQQGRIQISYDAGKTFTNLKDPLQNLPLSHDPVLNAASMPFQDLQARWTTRGSISILASGGTPVALTSTDSGTTWKTHRVGGQNPVFSGAIGPEGSMIIVGDRAQVYLHSADSKTDDWTPIHSANKEPWRAAEILSENPLKIATVGVRGRVGLYAHSATKKPKELWSVAQLPNIHTFTDIHIHTPTQWFAATNTGDVLSTRDGGARWTTVLRGDGRSLHRMTHAPSRGLLLQGPQLLSLFNTRTKMRSDLRNKGIDHIHDVHLSKAHKMAVGTRNLFLHKPSPDAPWTPHSPLSKTPLDLHSIAFTNGQNGWIAASNGTLFNTTDAAKTFSKITPKPGFSSPIFTLQAIDVRNLFIAGHHGFFALSNDRGSSFSPLPLPRRKEVALAPPNILSVSVTRSDKGIGLLVGAERGMLFERPPLQKDFILHDLGYFGNVRDIETQGNTSWILDTNGTILRRVGPSSPWQVLTVPPGTAWSHLAFSDNTSTALLLTRSGSLLRSTDTGASWFLAQYPKGRVLQDIIHYKGDTFVGIGHGGLIYHSTNGGRSWDTLPPVTGRTLHTLVQTSNGSLLACGVSGTCLHNTDPEAKVWQPWPDTPPALKNTHISSVAIAHNAEKDTIALGVPGAIWLRHGKDTPWLLLSASSKDTPHTLREVRRLHTHTSGDVIALGGDGRIWVRSGDSALQYTPLPASNNPNDPVGRAKDIVLTPNTANLQGHILMTDGRILSFSHTLNTATIDVQLAGPPPKRTTQAPIGRSTFGAQHTWLLGPGGLWALPNTSDASWHQVLPSLHTRPQDLSFVSTTEGYAANNDGSILYTRDGGVSWTLQETHTRTPLTSIHATPKLGTLAGGDGGLVLFSPPKPE